MACGWWSVDLGGGEFFEEGGGVLLWDEDAGWGEVEGCFEGEECGRVAGEDLAAVGVKVGAGRGEQDELTTERGREFQEDGTEVAWVALDCEDEGHSG